MKLYRFKPTNEIFRAIQFTGKNLQEIYTEFGVAEIAPAGTQGEERLILNCNHLRPTTALVGEWVLKSDSDHTFYRCTSVVLERDYVEVAGVVEDESLSVLAVLKVYDSLRNCDLDPEKAMECVRKMAEDGIIFRNIKRHIVMSELEKSRAQ